MNSTSAASISWQLWLSGNDQPRWLPDCSSWPASCCRPRCWGSACIHLSDFLLDDVVAVVRLRRSSGSTCRRCSGKPFPCGRDICRSCDRASRGSRLCPREHHLLAAVIDQHALEDFVQIERFAGHVLEIPGEFAVVGLQRDVELAYSAAPLPDSRLARIHGLGCATPQ